MGFSAKLSFRDDLQNRNKGSHDGHDSCQCHEVQSFARFAIHHVYYNRRTICISIYVYLYIYNYIRIYIYIYELSVIQYWCILSADILDSTYWKSRISLTWRWRCGVQPDGLCPVSSPLAHCSAGERRHRHVCQSQARIPNSMSHPDSWRKDLASHMPTKWQHTLN